MNWIYLPPWSVRIVAAIAVGLLALTIARRWREQRGGWSVGLRAAAIIVLLFVILNPQSLVPRQQTEKPKLIVLLDTSASMATPDASGQPRLSAALRVLDSSTLAALNKNFVVDVRRFDREVGPAELGRLANNAPSGDASDIGRAVMGAASELGDLKSQAGVLLVSDGRATAAGMEDAAQLALARSVPVCTPSRALTQTIAASHERAASRASAAKLASPGVSTRLSSNSSLADPVGR